MISHNVNFDKSVVTVTEAARHTGKTTGRIRQICREHEIGTLISGRLRLLNKADLKRIEKIIDETGRKFANSEN